MVFVRNWCSAKQNHTFDYKSLLFVGAVLTFLLKPQPVLRMSKQNPTKPNFQEKSWLGEGGVRLKTIPESWVLLGFVGTSLAKVKVLADKFG